MRVSLTLILALAVVTISAQTNIYTSQNGNFTSNSTWQGSKPGNRIDANEVVYVNHQVRLNGDLEVRGELIIGNNGSLITNNNRDVSVTNGGKILANGLIPINEFSLKDNNSRVEINDSTYVKNDASVTDNAKLIINGNAFFDKELTLEDADSILFNGNTFIDSKFELKDNTNLITGSTALLIVDDEFKIEDGSTFTSNGDLLVEKKFVLEDNTTVILNGTTRINDDLEVKDNTSLTFNGNAYITDDIKIEDNAGITIETTGLIEILGILEHEGNTLTVDGALIIRDFGNNGSESAETITGSGLIQIDGDGLENDGGTISGSLDICSSDASSNPLSGNNPSNSVTICSSNGMNFPIMPAAPLPVKLTDFYAVSNDKSVDLLWITLSELNSSYFSVEHSEDGVWFTELGTVEAIGNSNTPTEYSFRHQNPAPGKNYYRLVQFDKDGKFEEFNPIEVDINQPNNQLDNDFVIYPNPNNGEHVYIKLPENNPENISILINSLYKLEQIGDITFINQGDNGLMILEFEEKLSPGIYLINFLLGPNNYSKKLVVK